MVLQEVTARQYDPTFIIPIFPNFHINLLHKFTKCVIWLKNKISEPTTRLTTDIFAPKRFTQQGLGLGNSNLAYLNPIVSSPIEIECASPKSAIAQRIPQPAQAGFVCVVAVSNRRNSRIRKVGTKVLSRGLMKY